MSESPETQIPLPGQFRIDQRFEDTVQIGDLTLNMAGLIARRDDGNTIVGSAAGPEAAPIERAYYELVERACAVIARERGEERAAWDRAGRAIDDIPYEVVFPKSPGPSLRTSTSNGVALHTDAERARLSALCELVERDRVLRSWYGGARPRTTEFPTDDPLQALAAHYDLQAYRFDLDGDEIAVAGVFGFPKTEAAPLLCGMGAGETDAIAIGKASSESLQRLAFLWGEEIPTTPPTPAPTPDFHQDYYLFPAKLPGLRAWLAGEHGQDRALPPLHLDSARFADLTPRSLSGCVTATRALAEGAIPLVFGLRQALPDGPIPDHQQVHPLC